MEIIKDIEQGTEEWLNLRMGVATASKFKDVMAGGAGKTRKSYMYSLAAELITGQREESFSNQYMEWGTETEPQARAMYEFEACCDVEEVAFIKLGSGHAIGCSPDGLVGDAGMVEIKCPKTTTQIETFISGKMPTGHKAQVQGQLWVAKREWCDFISFDPRIEGAASYYRERIYRDEDYIKKLEEGCFKFETELTELVAKLKG